MVVVVVVVVVFVVCGGGGWGGGHVVAVCVDVHKPHNRYAQTFTHTRAHTFSGVSISVLGLYESVVGAYAFFSSSSVLVIIVC